MPEYTAEEMANMSATDLDALLSDFDIGSDYDEYFAAFDPSKIADINAQWTNKIGMLSSQSQQKFAQLGQKYKSQMAQSQQANLGAGQKMRQVEAQRGFQGAGDVQRQMGQQQQALFGETSRVLGDAASSNRFAQEQIGLQKESAGLTASQEKRSAYEDYQEKFYGALTNVETMMSDAEDQALADSANVGRRGMNLFGSNDPTSTWCVVSTALNDSGVWSDLEKKDAEKWCLETHHDGTDRGNTWIKGYHTWGKFLSKWVEKSNTIRWIIEGMTTAFVDHVRRNKPNYLGPIVHHLWINPLSYAIGYSKKNKILGKLGTVGMIGIYSLLLPLFGIATIPHKLKRKLWL